MSARVRDSKYALTPVPDAQAIILAVVQPLQAVSVNVMDPTAVTRGLVLAEDVFAKVWLHCMQPLTMQC